MHHRHCLEQRSTFADPTVRLENMQYRHTRLRRARLREGGGGQVGLLYEDRCREGLEQGEKVEKALTEAYPPYTNGNQG